MIWTNLDFLAVVAYGLVFFGLIFRAEMFQWFWASVAGRVDFGIAAFAGNVGDYPCRSVVCPAFLSDFCQCVFLCFSLEKAGGYWFLAGGFALSVFERVCRQQCIDDFGFCVDCRDIVFSDAGPFFGFYVSGFVETVRAQACLLVCFAVCHDGGFLSAPQKYCQAVAGGVQ